MARDWRGQERLCEGGKPENAEFEVWVGRVGGGGVEGKVGVGGKGSGKGGGKGSGNGEVNGSGFIGSEDEEGMREGVRLKK